MVRKLILTLFILCIFTDAAAFASEESPFAFPGYKTRKRNFLWPPIYSLAVPGLDQFIKGQTTAGVAFSGTAVGGLALYLVSGEHGIKNPDALSLNDDQRSADLGLEIAQVSGFMSSYHAFRTAVITRPEDFSFLKHEESDFDILLAPVHFSYMLEPTTYLALLVGAAAIFADVKTSGGNTNFGSPVLADGAFAGGFSYMAGTGEEALFRGTMMPIFRYYTDSNFWSNAITGTAFAAAHLGTVQLPVFQLVSGLYFGWVTQKNEWAIGENVFIHAWYDVMAFVAGYAVDRHSSIIVPVSFSF